MKPERYREDYQQGTEAREHHVLLFAMSAARAFPHLGPERGDSVLRACANIFPGVSIPESTNSTAGGRCPSAFWVAASSGLWVCAKGCRPRFLSTVVDVEEQFTTGEVHVETKYGTFEVLSLTTMSSVHGNWSPLSGRWHILHSEIFPSLAGHFLYAQVVPGTKDRPPLCLAFFQTVLKG